jgi:hypothetical protein
MGVGSYCVWGYAGDAGALVRLAAKWSASVVGIAMLAAGVIRSVQADSSAGNIALLIIGAGLLLSPFFIDRITGVSISPASFEIRLAREISDLGAPATAVVLERTDLAGFTQSYAYVHEALSDPRFRDARIHLQDLLVQHSAATAGREKFNANEVQRLFRDGSPIMRVLALGLMKGDRSLADSATIISAIGSPRSRNEQYQGLKLAELCWPSLPKTDQQAIHHAIRSSGISAGSGRRRVADAVLDLQVG